MAQIGTVKLETQNGIRSVPVHEFGDSGSNVFEFLRVQTPSGAGFLPLTDPVNAQFQEIRVQTQNGILAIHDAPTV